MTDFIHLNTLNSCLGRTCLQWREDGELTSLDLSLVLERLARVDGQLSMIDFETVDPDLILPAPNLSEPVAG